MYWQPREMPRVGAPLPEDLRNILHPWSDGMFECGTHTFRTLQGAYQAHRGSGFQAGFESLSGGQAWARGARSGLPHRPSILRMAVGARYADLDAFRSAVHDHKGPFRVWHQERRIGQLLEVLYAQLRHGRLAVQASLAVDSPDWGKQP